MQLARDKDVTDYVIAPDPGALRLTRRVQLCFAVPKRQVFLPGPT